MSGRGTITTLPFEYTFGGQTFPGARCGSCGLIFVSVQPDRKALEEMYGTPYFESDFRCGSAPAAYFAEEKPFRREAISILALITRLTGKKAGRLLEIGCAGGWLLKAAENAGWKATGVEISPQAAAFARTELGLDVFEGSLAEAAFPPGTFDVIYMGDVLEHIPDPVGLVLELKRTLAAGGCVVAGGPTALNALARRLGLAVYRALGKTKTIELPPYHLFEYTPRTIRRLFESAGLEVFHLEPKKIPPRLRKVTLEEILTYAIELLTFPISAAFGVWTDRVILCARKPEEA
ncbi:MAG: class I SAM-dependent methyltransferase, partial [Candidatus Eisenbacteria bacterium]